MLAAGKLKSLCTQIARFKKYKHTDPVMKFKSIKPVFPPPGANLQIRWLRSRLDRPEIRRPRRVRTQRVYQQVPIRQRDRGGRRGELNRRPWKRRSCPPTCDGTCWCSRNACAEESWHGST